MQTRGLSLYTRLVIAVWFTAEYVPAIANYCAYSKQSVIKFSHSMNKSLDEDGGGESFLTELLDGNRTQKCHPSFKYCYAIWQEDYSNKNSTVILAQGCWEIGKEFDCTEGECISNKRPPKVMNHTKFCCCIGNKCNENMTDGYQPYDEAEPSPRFVEHASYDTQTVIIAVVTMCSLAIIIVLAACVTYHMCSSTQKPNPDATYLMEPPPSSSPTFNIENLRIKEIIGRGHYGHVYKGTLYNQTIAVKIFAAQSRSYYLNERYIYCLPFMEHPCLLKLFGAEERTGADDRPEYLLVLTYAPLGCLQDFLTNSTIDWSMFCKMAQTITQGLAHLHTEIRKDGRVKMCIAHRDLTSRNILVNTDGSCMLCDFGFAICISGSKYYVSGEEQVAEATSLTDVGTLRYMAPEVLEGAVNLRDCESSLKQIDVYALGLVLWEIATRCTDLFQGVEVPEYKLPFMAEIGLHPTMEQMQVLVARHKARPLFPDIWKDTNPALRSLKETIDDCWDQDAEARLTSLCVEERLLELPVLWDRHKAGTTIQGVSPTVNPTSTQQNMMVSAPVMQSSAMTWNKGLGYEMPVIRSNSEMSTPNNGIGIGRDCSVSENTVETSITVSPSELTPNSCASCSSNSGGNMKNLSANNNVTTSNLRVTVPLQPYQGKNPIMERNLILYPTEELAVSGNSLVEKKATSGSSGSVPVENSFPFEGSLFNTLGPSETSESNALVSNDELGHSTRTCNPIPYVQNAVHAMGTVPKQQNVPGNGHVLQGIEATAAKKREDKPKLFSGLRNFFKLSKSGRSPSRADLSPVSVPLISEDPNPAPTVNVPKYTEGNPDTNPKNILDTEVYVSASDGEFGMTQTIVRPVANKQIYSQTVSCENEEAGSTRNSTGMPGVGVVQSQTHPILSSDFMNSVEHHLPSKDAIKVVKRPNTLPVAKLGSRKNSDLIRDIYLDKPMVETDSLSSDGINLESGEKTCRNPDALAQLKSMRSSLYDDRIMSAESQLQFMPCIAKKLSPQTSSSVPQSIDSICDSESSGFHESCQKQPNGILGSAYKV